MPTPPTIDDIVTQLRRVDTKAMRLVTGNARHLLDAVDQQLMKAGMLALLDHALQGHTVGLPSAKVFLKPMMVGDMVSEYFKKRLQTTFKIVDENLLLLFFL